MPELGLFPLGVVLLPGEQLPLHVFEPRYRELVGECIEQNAEFGLLHADDDGEREVGTTAGVAEVVRRFPDGRLNVVVEGRERFRVARRTEGRSFDTAEIELLPDEPDLAEPGAIERSLHLYRRLAEQAGAESPDEPALTPRLAYAIAARVDFGPQIKQELLEERSERIRLRRVVELLERAVQAIALERDIGDRASRNGKVTRLPE
jgi:ATP-dependent Lon protease